MSSQEDDKCFKKKEKRQMVLKLFCNVSVMFCLGDYVTCGIYYLKIAGRKNVSELQKVL